jgi:glycosyltransferase involved in cell wall biosynthesis
MGASHGFVGMLRIKNEERWIADVIESMLPLCEKLFIFDDHSTDSTREICRRYDAVTLYESPFQGIDESRDKNWLLDQIMSQCVPQWILCLDGDEVLEKRGPDIIRETCLADGSCQAYSLQIAFLWNDPHTVRVDRIYGDFWRPSLFRPFVPRENVPDDLKLVSEFRFMATPFGRKRGNDQPNLHCSSVPQRRLHGRKLCPTRIKHYGYMARADRVRKLDFYTSIDWLNRAEDCYRHMTQGDNATLEELPRVQQLLAEGLIGMADVQYITNVPPNAHLLHAGPIQVRPWDEDQPWPVSDWARSVHRGVA